MNQETPKKFATAVLFELAAIHAEVRQMRELLVEQSIKKGGEGEAEVQRGFQDRCDQAREFYFRQLVQLAGLEDNAPASGAK